MKQSRFTENQLVSFLTESKSGLPLEELIRIHGISKDTFCKWKAKYSGMDASALKHIKELEDGNRYLKQMYADLSLEHRVLKV
jgi:putative transposase